MTNYLWAFVFVDFVLGLALMIARHNKRAEAEKEAQLKKRELTYDYDPKNWDTLNK